jgi:site-specific DNA-cytosine methylase
MALDIRVIKHAHFFCGAGGGARGFNRGHARVGNIEARGRCIGGIDVHPGVIKDFENRSGVRGTVLDLFDLEQYLAFHGHMPPPGWREATTADIHMAFSNEDPDVVFLSAPCKGFSGLLSESKSKTDKYQALNRLTLRGVWLMLEAYKDKPIKLIVFENVPRIATRGRSLLDQIIALFRAYGYAVAETTHDCGELGELAQSRKRFLLVARHMEQVPASLYEPEKHNLRGVGEILSQMPLPGDLRGGPMHRIPQLQMKTWLRLAFVKAGSDWRSLNELAVENGHLRDFLLVPEMQRTNLGVNGWDDSMGAITSRGLPTNGAFAVADPRQELYAAGGGVVGWEQPSGAVAGESLPSNGRFAVADVRFDQSAKWSDGQAYGVHNWTDSTGAIAGQQNPGQGAYAVADPRHLGAPKFNNCFRIVGWDAATGAVTSAGGPGQAVADPRPSPGTFGKYPVTDFGAAAGTIISGSTTGQGAFAVSDPRPPAGPLFSKYMVTPFDASAGTVIGGDDSGAYAVADPRPNLARGKGDAYLTAGHYGVQHWEAPSGAVSAAAGHDNGKWSVADPRPASMPALNQKLVAYIRALDGTWHRPFTTLELAALQSLVDPEECWGWDYEQDEVTGIWHVVPNRHAFQMEGKSDQEWRERIGNAVPPAAAQAIANVMFQTILLAEAGETFKLSAMPIWVRPVAVALAVQGA